MVSQTEWTFYPNFGQPRTFHVGKRCLLEGGHHYRTIRCSSERTLEVTIGRKKQGMYCKYSVAVKTHTFCRMFKVLFQQDYPMKAIVLKLISSLGLSAFMVRLSDGTLECMT